MYIYVYVWVCSSQTVMSIWLFILHQLSRVNDVNYNVYLEMNFYDPGCLTNKGMIMYHMLCS